MSMITVQMVKDIQLDTNDSCSVAFDEIGQCYIVYYGPEGPVVTPVSYSVPMSAVIEDQPYSDESQTFQ